jgi:cytochrome c oxidase subunit III
MPAALEHAPVILEPAVPGGGGPGEGGPDDPGGGGGGGGDGDEQRRMSLYKLGLGLALISITALFAAVAVVYYTRSQIPQYWVPVRPPRGLWLSTGILLLSSLMIEWARRALSAHRWFVYRRRLLLTTFLGFAFMAAQLLALTELIRDGMYLRSNPHASVFYVFTGLHGIHLIGGMFVLVYLLLRRGRNWFRHRTISDLIAIYWHFMGILWLALFSLLLLL